MKKITLLLSLLITVFVGAFADGFTPAQGVKYLIKCKGNSRYVLWNANCNKSGNNVLSNWEHYDERSFFTFEEKTVGNQKYYYIRSAKDNSQYVYAINTNNEDGNVGVKQVTDTPDDACLWTINYNPSSMGFNIRPKGSNNDWNNRGLDDSQGNATVGLWNGGGNANDNTWFIMSQPVDIAEGYYTITNQAKDSRNKILGNSTTDSKSVSAASLPTTLTNNYVWHITKTNNSNVYNIVNGLGNGIVDGNNNVLNQITIPYENNGKYIVNFLNATNHSPWSLTYWTAGGTEAGDNQWVFTKIDDDYTVYNTTSNIDNLVTLTNNQTNEKVNGINGFFVYKTAINLDDFTVGTVEGYTSTLTIENNQLKVTYNITAEEMQKRIAAATELLNHKGLGYPTEDATERKQLSDAINAANNDQTNADLAAELETASNAFINSNNVVMPTDGKAYRIAYYFINNSKLYLNWNGEKMAVVADDDITNKNTSIFICHKVGDKYMFATNQGTYLSWMDSGDAQKSFNTKGCTDTYDNHNAWTIEIADANANGGTITAGRADLFGRMQMKSINKGGDQTFYLNARMDGNFISGYANTKYYDTGGANQPRSHAFVFEAVDYPNEVNFNATNGDIKGIDYIATFSAPFATIIPEGVTAYYVSNADDKATMTEVEGEALPANTGVILAANKADKVVMIPASTETTATITNNSLANSAGATKELTLGNAYVLGNGSEGIAFYPAKTGTLPMNKAYLTASNELNAIALDFGNVTAINAITTNNDINKTPIYDITGRRVAKINKGGLYIKNGKKFIVK